MPKTYEEKQSERRKKREETRIAAREKAGARAAKLTTKQKEKADIANRKAEEENKLREKIWMKTTIKYHPDFHKWLWFATDLNQNPIGKGNGDSIRACSLQVEELRKLVIYAAKNDMGVIL